MSILYEKEADDNQDDSSYNLPKFHASTDIKDTENECGKFNGLIFDFKGDRTQPKGNSEALMRNQSFLSFLKVLGQNGLFERDGIVGDIVFADD